MSRERTQMNAEHMTDIDSSLFHADMQIHASNLNLNNNPRPSASFRS